MMGMFMSKTIWKTAENNEVVQQIPDIRFNTPELFVE